MVAITTDPSVCTVMVRLETDPGDFDAVAAVVRAHAGLFDTRDGFLGRAMHLAYDRTEIVHYLRWRSLADHEACMADPDMQREGAGMLALIESGKARMSVRTYAVDSAFSGD